MQIEKMQEYLRIIKAFKGDDKEAINHRILLNENSHNEFVNNMFNICLGDPRVFLALMDKFGDIEEALYFGKSIYPKAESRNKIEMLEERIDIYTATPNATRFWTKKSVVSELYLREITGIGRREDSELLDTFDKMIESAGVYLQKDKEAGTEKQSDGIQASIDATKDLPQRLEEYGYSKPVPEDGILYLCNNINFLFFANCMLISSMDVDDAFCEDVRRIIDASLHHEMMQSAEEKHEYRSVARITKRNLSRKKKKGQIMSLSKKTGKAA